MLRIKVVQDLVLIIRRTLDHPVQVEVEVKSATIHRLDSYVVTPRPEDLRELSADIQGMILGFNETCCLIASDRFGTVPAYAYQTPTIFILSTNFAAIFEHIDSALSLDQVAMWESLLLDMPLGTRTLIQGIRHIGPGVMIVLDFGMWTASETRYYNFHFSSVLTLSSEQSAAHLIEALLTSLRKVARGPLLLPLSGGIDSRLLATALCHVVSADEIHAVTFAFDKLSLELRYAEEVCRRLGIKRHTFYRITPDCYTAALPDFVGRFGGVVSIYHAHLYSFLLSSAGVRHERLVSGFFADAAAGYASAPPGKTSAKPQDSSYYGLLEYWNNRFPVPCMLDIMQDFEKIYRSWQSGTSISSFDEYLYVSQRQQRLLFPLASMYREFLPVEMPYATPAVADVLFAMPYKVRQFKDGIRNAIRKLSPQLADLPDISSKTRLVTWGDWSRAWGLRLWHWMTVAGAMVTRDRVRLPDIIQTEDHGMSLRTVHRDLLLSSIDSLVQVGLLNIEQANVLRANSYDYHFAVPQYRIITLAHLITHLRNKEVLAV